MYQGHKILDGLKQPINIFTPNLASLSSPFREPMQKNIQFNWSKVHFAAFEKIKKENSI